VAIYINLNLYSREEAVVTSVMVAMHEGNESGEAYIFRCNPGVQTKYVNKYTRQDPHYRVSSYSSINEGERLDGYIHPRYKDHTRKVNGFTPLHCVGYNGFDFLGSSTKKVISAHPPKDEEKVS